MEASPAAWFAALLPRQWMGLPYAADAALVMTRHDTRAHA
jgi:hypothetical protein